MQFFLQQRIQTIIPVLIPVLFGCIILTTTLSAQQEHRVTEKRVITDEAGQTHKTISVIESKVEDISPTVQNVIHTGAFRLPWMYNLNYTRAISNNFAIGGGLEIPTTIMGRSTPRGFGVVTEARFYPGNMALRGFYVSGGLNFHSLTEERIEYIAPTSPTTPPTIVTKERSFTPFSLNITTGWVILAWNELSIDLGLGVKHHFISAGDKDSNVYSDNVTSVGPDIFSGTAPTIRINIGYAW